MQGSCVCVSMHVYNFIVFIVWHFIKFICIYACSIAYQHFYELKNCILFDGAKAPHFNYVGDSILGFNAHLGAGSITSNVKSDKSLVVVKTKKERIATGLKRVGAFVGDFAEIGCNSVLNPGTIVGKNALIYPLSSVRGEVEANTLYKGENRVEKRR